MSWCTQQLWRITPLISRQPCRQLLSPHDTTGRRSAPTLEAVPSTTVSPSLTPDWPSVHSDENRVWYQQDQQQKIQTTESAPCVVPTEPATEDTDYRICIVHGIDRTSDRRYRLQNLHRVCYQQNHQQQKIETTESAPCVVSTEPATEDTDNRICTVRGINRTTSNMRYRLQNLHRAWYQQNNQQQSKQTIESAPCVISAEAATEDTDYS